MKEKNKPKTIPFMCGFVRVNLDRKTLTVPPKIVVSSQGVLKDMRSSNGFLHMEAQTKIPAEVFNRPKS